MTLCFSNCHYPVIAIWAKFTQTLTSIEQNVEEMKLETPPKTKPGLDWIIVWGIALYSAQYIIIII